MDITDIRIKQVSTAGKLKAYVTVTFDDCFVVHNLKIIAGKAGTFIAMPSRKTKTGEYKDIAHPINSDFRQRIQNRIIDEYERVKEEAGPEQEGRVAAAEDEDLDPEEDPVHDPAGDPPEDSVDEPG